MLAGATKILMETLSFSSGIFKDEDEKKSKQDDVSMLMMAPGEQVNIASERSEERKVQTQPRPSPR